LSCCATVATKICGDLSCYATVTTKMSVTLNYVFVNHKFNYMFRFKINPVLGCV
jgi:hypothetical protein